MDNFQFATLVTGIQNVVNTVLIPLAILWAGWQIIYLAIFCGLIGADPLDMIPEGHRGHGGDDMSWPRVWQEIKLRLSGFARGLAWVAGIWVIFNAVLMIVSFLATQIDAII